MKIFNKRFSIQYTFAALISIILPKLINVLIKAMTNLYYDEWVANIIIIVIIFVLCLVTEFIISFIKKISKRERTISSVVQIDSIGSKYLYTTPNNIITSKANKTEIFIDEDELFPNKETPLFNISSSEEELAETLLNKKYKAVIYYSLAVKKEINWIDYVYMSFLRDVKKRLNCTIIVYIYNIDANEANNRRFKTFIKDMIPGVVLLNEKTTYLENPKEYAVNFRSFYLAKIIEYIHLSVFERKKFDSNLFRSYLGYLESVFPIKEIAKKYVNSRQLFVLDRHRTQKLWADKNLAAFKGQYHIIFIGARTLTDGNNNKLNIYASDTTDPHSVLNITDNDDLLALKLANMDLYVKRQIFSLLCASLKIESEVPDSKQLDRVLINMIKSIKIPALEGEYCVD